MGFTFSQLLDLPAGEVNRVDLAALKEKLPNTPDIVLKDVYSDHGRSQEFQMRYGHLAIDQFKWSIHIIEAQEILKCSFFDPFDWMKLVSQRVDNFKDQGWGCVDARQEVIDQWKSHRTWQIAPYFIAGRFINRKKKLHVIEGHTRIGLLRGLVKAKIVDKNHLHSIWLAE